MSIKNGTVQISSVQNKKLVDALLTWFATNQRQLPWRMTRNPYHIWISEVMLQQTTTQAVVPYFEKFLLRFPTLTSLAEAKEEDLLEAWAGLGYYSRARNLHKAAKLLAARSEFPKTWTELIALPGFGPYTSRSVASIAFDEKVGVVDGNVIRVLCRINSWQADWWKPQEREKIQIFADQLANLGPPSLVNQALMELGASICSPQNPSCILCPVKKQCSALKSNSVSKFPKAKPRKAAEPWLWLPQIEIKKEKVLLVKNKAAPILKNQWIFPGDFQKLNSKPSEFDFKHTITHHDIHVRVAKTHAKLKSEILWVNIKDLKKINPSSLLQKTLIQFQTKSSRK